MLRIRAVLSGSGFSNRRDPVIVLYKMSITIFQVPFDFFYFLWDKGTLSRESF
jgi:hypothetical protein